MNRGPKRKPDGLKIITGNFRRDRANPRQPKVKVSTPDRPELIKGKARIALWDELVAKLTRAKILTNLDGWLLAQYVDLYCWLQEQRKDRKMPPASYHSQLGRMASTLGLDPSSRTGLKIPDGDDDDPNSDFFDDSPEKKHFKPINKKYFSKRP